MLKKTQHPSLYNHRIITKTDTSIFFFYPFAHKLGALHGVVLQHLTREVVKAYGV